MKKVVACLFFGIALFIGSLAGLIQHGLEINSFNVYLRENLPGYLSPSPIEVLGFVLEGLLVFIIALGVAWIRYEKKVRALGVLVVSGSLGGFMFAWGGALIHVYTAKLTWGKDYLLVSGIMSIPEMISGAGIEFATTAVIIGILAGLVGLLLGKFLFLSTGIALQEKKVGAVSQTVRENKNPGCNNPNALAIKLRALFRLG